MLVSLGRWTVPKLWSKDIHPKTPPKSIQEALSELSKVSQISNSPARLISHTESEFTHELKDDTVESTELIGEFIKFVWTRKKFDITILLVREMSKTINASVNQDQFPSTRKRPRGYRDKISYTPFEHLVNSALNKARKLLPLSCLGYGKDLTFYVYNAPTHGHSLKPDGIGILSTTEFSSETDRVSWKGVHLFYEAKSQFKEMGHQAGTYAHVLQTYQPNRVFVYSFLHAHNKDRIHFSLFDRGGCTYSNSLDICETKDQETMAQILLSFLVLPPLCLGVDTSICPNGSWINLYGYRFKIDRVLAYRECVRGHATRVYLASKPMEGIEEGPKAEMTDEGKKNYNKLEFMRALDEFVLDAGSAICVTFKEPLIPVAGEPVEIVQTDSGLPFDRFTSSAQFTELSRPLSKRGAEVGASSHLQNKVTTKRQVDTKDKAVCYSDLEKREIRSQRSGTLPFIARHILEGTNVPHCPVHDLESKIYLAFWVAAYIVRCKTKSRNLRKDILIDIIKMLRPDSWDELRDCSRPKGGLMIQWAYQPVDKAKRRFFGAFAPFTEILHEMAKLGEKWYEISVKHARASTMFSNDEIEQAFVEYLDVYDKYMPTEESWDYLQGLEIT